MKIYKSVTQIMHFLKSNCAVLILCIPVGNKNHCSIFYRLVGDILLCTGFLSYSGPFNQEFRNKLISNWQKELGQRKIPFTSDLNLISMLVDNATVSYIIYLELIHYKVGNFKKLNKTTNILGYVILIFFNRLENGTFKVYQMMSCLFKMVSSQQKPQDIHY